MHLFGHCSRVFFFWNQSIKLWFDFLPVNNTAEMYVLYKALTFLQFLLD